MVLHAKALDYLYRQVDFVTASSSTSERLHWCRDLNLVLQSLLFGICFLWASARAWLSFCVEWNTNESIQVDIAAISTDQDDTLAHLIELNATYGVTCTKRLLDCIHCIIARAWANRIVMYFNRLVRVIRFQVAKHESLLKTAIDSGWNRRLAARHDVVQLLRVFSVNVDGTVQTDQRIACLCKNLDSTHLLTEVIHLDSLPQLLLLLNLLAILLFTFLLWFIWDVNVDYHFGLGCDRG